MDPGRYHETLMRAWVGAVANLMAQVGATVSFEDSAARASVLLDPAAMGTHYTQERLFSDEARARFVVPDLDPIPGA